MDWLRADAKELLMGFPIAAHVTTTITGSGATCYGMNVFDNDSAATKASNSNGLIKKAEGSFYHSVVPMLTVELHSVSGTAASM